MKDYYKGALVTKQSEIKSTGQDSQHMWVIIDGSVYDLTDYFHTLKVEDDYPLYKFLGDPAEQLIQNNAGLDITQDWETSLNYTYRTNVLNCMNNMFYIGDVMPGQQLHLAGFHYHSVRRYRHEIPCSTATRLQATSGTTG